MSAFDDEGFDSVVARVETEAVAEVGLEPIPDEIPELPVEIDEPVVTPVDKYPTLVAAVVYVIVLVAAKFGFDLEAEAVTGVATALVAAAVAWVHRRVSPVAKADRGFTRRVQLVDNFED